MKEKFFFFWNDFRSKLRELTSGVNSTLDTDRPALTQFIPELIL